MQSLLMVAALECGRGGFGQDAQYDNFVRANRSSLINFNDSIKIYYTRAYGPIEGRAAYDHFTTALANRHANRAASSPDFCNSAASLLRLASEARPSELVALASDVEERPFGVGLSCDEARQIAPQDRLPPPVYDAYAQTAVREDDNAVAVALPDLEPPTAPPLYREVRPPVVDAIPAAAAAPEPPLAVVPVEAPRAPAPLEPMPVAVAAAEPTPPPALVRAAAVVPPPATSPAAALAAAAQALQAAAEALRASATATADAPADAAPVIRERVPARKL